MILNVRLGKHGITADIERAFLQIELAQKIEKVTFGVTCSPFHLIGVLLKHLKDESINFPETCELLKESFYVDDLIVSVDDFEDAVKLFNETREILSRASMNIRKWKSNNEKLR
ncbi:unnamed protein product [Hermetia illucens]|uniref:Reverse transcriptase domain-containing protein n=2 Tax=Hermetia illucens TaxID=343691 RepID=A0A7R8YZK1_HERIL|nr:unnamed protein product [Hermetia illucens]